jgi:hypothetical protein
MSMGARLVLHAKYNWYQRVGYVSCALRWFATSRHELRIRHELSFLHLIHSPGFNLAMNCRPPIRRQRSMTGCARWVCPRRRRERPGRRLRGVGLQPARIGLREGRPRLALSLAGSSFFPGWSILRPLAPASISSGSSPFRKTKGMVVAAFAADGRIDAEVRFVAPSLAPAAPTSSRSMHSARPASATGPHPADTNFTRFV